VYYEATIVLTHSKSTLVLQQYVYGDGTIKINYKISVPSDAPNIPRVGLAFVVSDSLSNISFYGRGPHENYIDSMS
jgi:hypothetical protein